MLVRPQATSGVSEDLWHAADLSDLRLQPLTVWSVECRRPPCPARLTATPPLLACFLAEGPCPYVRRGQS